MHVLPLEIQHSIFLWACTDGGRTGLALTLISKSYRDAVRPVRLHSVAIRAFPHIDGVLQSYKRDLKELGADGSTLKPCIQHLLLSPEESSAVEDEAYIASVVALLQLVGPTLTTLAYAAQLCFTRLGGDCPMPKLEELTVFLNPRERQSTALPHPPHPPASYPALRKLHIVLWGTVLPSVMPWWAEAAPNVTDLRLTNMERGGGMEWAESMLDEDRAKRPYRSVRRMIIEPHYRPAGGWCGTSGTREMNFVRTLQGLREQVPEDMQLMVKEWDGKRANRVTDVEQYWIDGVNGGVGGWQRPDEATGDV